MVRASLLLLLVGCTQSPTPVSPPPVGFTLTSTETLRRLNMTLTAEGVPVGAEVYFVRESRRHSPACPPRLAPGCFSLAGVQLLGQATATSNVVTLTRRVPANAPIGLPLTFQAAYLSPLGTEFSTLAGTIVGNPGDGHTGDTDSDTDPPSDTDTVPPVDDTDPATDTDLAEDTDISDASP